MAELNEGKFSHIVDNDCVKKPGRELCCLSTRTAIKRGEGREDSCFKFWPKFWPKGGALIQNGAYSGGGSNSRIYGINPGTRCNLMNA